MVIFHISCDLWCLHSYDFAISENNILAFYNTKYVFSKYIQFLLCFFVFIVLLVKNNNCVKACYIFISSV